MYLNIFHDIGKKSILKFKYQDLQRTYYFRLTILETIQFKRIIGNYKRKNLILLYLILPSKIIIL